MQQTLILQRSDALVLPPPRARAVRQGRGARQPGMVPWLLASFALLAAAVGWDLASRGLEGSILGPAIHMRLPLGSVSSLITADEKEPVVANTAMTADRARAINAAIPFWTGPLLPARPFRFAADGASRARARDCLAAAAWYEAGQDTLGQRSVIQVVLNRVSHPAFPKTVCGVVYQGAERRTGCQFTFTCDGSLFSRRPSREAWARARANAEIALAGFVDPSVGLATHYHTDWVAPRWSPLMAKIARVGTHLFFRFHGSAGQPGAYAAPPGWAEPRIAAMALVTGARELPGEAAVAGAEPAAALPAPHAPLAGPALLGSRIAAADAAGTRFALQLNMAGAWGRFADVARRLCQGRGTCMVMGWTPAMAPQAMDAFQARRRSALFVFRRTGAGEEVALWDCRSFPRPPEQCLPGTVPEPPEPPVPPHPALAAAEPVAAAGSVRP